MASHFARVCSLTFRLSRRIPLLGFDVRAFLLGPEERADVEAKLETALTLFAQYSPVRFNYFRRDVARLYIGPTDAQGTWIQDLEMCVIGLDYAEDATTSPVELALTLVHEGMHARLIRAGFGYGEDVRARIEGMCVRAEIIVARRIPEGRLLAAEAERRVTLGARYWTDDEVRARMQVRLARLGWAGKVGSSIGWLLSHLRIWRGSD